MYGAPKIWAQLNREGIDVARCTGERLMREPVIQGTIRAKPKRTTIAADDHGEAGRSPSTASLWVPAVNDG